MTDTMMTEALLRRVAARLTAEPDARFPPDASAWSGPAREAYLLLHTGLLRRVDAALQAVEQAQWRVAMLREALHALG